MNCAASLFDVRNAQLSGIESEAINKIDIYTNVHKCNIGSCSTYVHCLIKITTMSEKSNMNLPICPQITCTVYLEDVQTFFIKIKVNFVLK